MILAVLYALLSLLDVLSSAEENLRARTTRMDCVRASEQCLKEQACSTKYRTMRQCVAGGKESNFSSVAGLEAKDECRSAIDALKQSPLYNCRCKRGMKKEKNCLRIYWGVYQTLQGNDFLEDSPYEPVNSRLSDISLLAPIMESDLKEQLRNLSKKKNDCLNAAKACNLNDTCKKYRSAYISPCTSRVSTAEVCNKRKCHKALRQFFDKISSMHLSGCILCTIKKKKNQQSQKVFCSKSDIISFCTYTESTCKPYYVCFRSRLADFFVNCQPEPRSLSGCLKENYADCLLAYSGLIGTVMTPNYLRSPKISVSPYCDCSNSGNVKDDCDKFTEFFTENTCLRNAIQAFGNGTDVGMWQPMSPVQTTTSTTTPSQRNRERNPNNIDNHINT
uniref:GDNF family receptor alpha 1 n=1 Tax=Tetraodon nigroviridis TaxID=99883 RepID=H3CWX3_TETNG